MARGRKPVVKSKLEKLEDNYKKQIAILEEREHKLADRFYQIQEEVKLVQEQKETLGKVYNEERELLLKHIARGLLNG